MSNPRSKERNQNKLKRGDAIVMPDGDIGIFVERKKEMATVIRGTLKEQRSGLIGVTWKSICEKNHLPF